METDPFKLPLPFLWVGQRKYFAAQYAFLSSCVSTAAVLVVPHIWFRTCFPSTLSSCISLFVRIVLPLCHIFNASVAILLSLHHCIYCHRFLPSLSSRVSDSAAIINPILPLIFHLLLPPSPCISASPILFILHLYCVYYADVFIVPHLCRCRLHRYASLSPNYLRVFPPIVARFVIISPFPSLPYSISLWCLPLYLPEDPLPTFLPFLLCDTTDALGGLVSTSAINSAMHLRPSRSIAPKTATSIVPHLFCHPPRVSSAAVSIFPYICHLWPCCPASPLQLSSAARTHLQPCLPSPLSCISTAPPLSSSSVYFAVVSALYSIVPFTLPPLFVFLLGSVILHYLRCSALHFSLRFAPHYFSKYPFWSYHYNFLLYLGTDLLSLCDVLTPLLSAAFFLHFPSLRSSQIWSLPSALFSQIFLLCLCFDKLWLKLSFSDLLALICLYQLAHICSVFFSSGNSSFS